MMSGVSYRCFFGEKCIINIDTRNRCKPCRFNRCIEQGMSIDSVKLGRIPKNVKAKALRDHYNRQEQNKNQDITILSDDDCDTQDSNDKTPEIVIIPNGNTIDLIELTISSPATLNSNLSLLRLPTVFHSSSSSEILNPNSVKLTSDTSSDHKMMTVSRYISNLSENTLIDYMFNCELRYSKNVLQIMKYILPKLCQPFLIYELDVELMSFFRYIRWKMLNFYLKHTIRVRMLVQRMFGIINLGVSEKKKIDLINKKKKFFQDYRLSRCLYNY